jgi:hypothetical protein
VSLPPPPKLELLEQFFGEGLADLGLTRTGLTRTGLALTDFGSALIGRFSSRSNGRFNSRSNFVARRRVRCRRRQFCVLAIVWMVDVDGSASG